MRYIALGRWKSFNILILVTSLDEVGLGQPLNFQIGIMSRMILFSKTTTMLFKMLGIQRAYEQCKDSMPKPRQIFVTKSRVLAAKVEEYFTKLLESLSTGQKTKEELAVMIKSKRQQQDRSLVDADDDQNWRSDLPLKYSNLRDEHFPLFLTFDRVC